MQKLRNDTFAWLKIPAAMVLGALLAGGILRGAEKDADGIFNFTTGEVVSASDMNANFKLLMARIKALEANQVPAGAVLAFAVTCPSGWSPADGSSGAPDLRGVFVRGLNNFGLNADGQGLNVAGTNDPDARAVGSFQNFQVGPHNHAPDSLLLNNPPIGSAELGNGFSVGLNFHDSGARGLSRNGGVLSNGGVESRPRNVALYFCMKQ